jgi:predicted methyltransferase
VGASIAAAVADPARPERDRARDASQKPAELLAFAGVRPGDRIADFWPAPPYSTRLLSRVAGPAGRVYAILPQKTVADFPGTDGETRDALAPYSNVTVLVEPFDAFMVPEPLDVVWMGKIYHDLPNVAEMGVVDIGAMNRAIFRALKPGGVYMVVEHAAVPGSGYLDTEPDMKKRLHRIDPKIVEAQVKEAGFVLEATSTLLANPDDDHLSSVFNPRLSGRTDRFVFKFRRP